MPARRFMQDSAERTWSAGASSFDAFVGTKPASAPSPPSSAPPAVRPRPWPKDSVLNPSPQPPPWRSRPPAGAPPLRRRPARRPGAAAAAAVSGRGSRPSRRKEPRRTPGHGPRTAGRTSAPHRHSEARPAYLPHRTWEGRRGQQGHPGHRRRRRRGRHPPGAAEGKAHRGRRLGRRYAHHQDREGLARAPSVGGSWRTPSGTAKSAVGNATSPGDKALPHWNGIPHRGPGARHAGPLRSPGSRDPRAGWSATGTRSTSARSMRPHHEFGIRRRIHQRRLHVCRPTDIRRAACSGRLHVCPCPAAGEDGPGARPAPTAAQERRKRSGLRAGAASRRPTPGPPVLPALGPRAPSPTKGLLQPHRSNHA